MTIKTILLHGASDDHWPERLSVAVELAARHAAHLTVLYTVDPLGLPAAVIGRGASAAYLGEVKAIATEKAAAVEAGFRARCERAGLSHEWRNGAGDPVDLLAMHARYADLAVVSQTPPETLEDLVAEHLPDHLTLFSGSPALIVPQGPRPTTFGRRVLVGWKSTRDAARAVRDALPLLAAAEQVVVLTVGPPRSDHVPGAEIATFLARHGIRVETRADHDGESRAGEILLAAARDLDCDLLVMGAYGHSRLRQLVLGGATRHVLRNMRLPVLMSH